DVAFGAATIAIFDGADSLADLRGATAHAVAEGDGAGFGIEHVMARTFIAVFEAVHRLPIGPSRRFLDLDQRGSGDDGAMDQLEALACVAVSGADEFGRRLDHLDDFGRIDSREQERSDRTRGIAPRRPGPENHVLRQLLILELRWKGTRA